MDQEVSLSIEETNRLRAQLGLKPLAVDDNAQQEKPSAEQNFAQHKAAMREEREKKELAERLEKNRQKRLRNQELQGTTLADADQDVDDVQAWVKRSRKMRSVGDKEKELEEMDRELQEAAQRQKYSSEDLRGLTVLHDINDLEGESEQILVLKDASVLEEGDELINVQVAERERLRDNMDRKAKLKSSGSKAYQAYEEDMNRQGSILSQYDDDGTAGKKSFVLTGNEEIKLNVSTKPSMNAAQAMDLEYEDEQREIEDYAAPEEITFKKVKKKKKKSSRREVDDSIDLQATIEAINARDLLPAGSTSSRVNSSSFVDDEDLQAALTKSRKSALNTQKSLKDIAAEVESTAAVLAPSTSGGIVLSDTSEFVRNLASIIEDEEPKEKNESVQKTEMDVESNDVDMEPPAAEEMEREERVETEDEDTIHKILDEPVINAGVGSALQLLRNKGLLDERTEEDKERDQALIEKQKWMEERRKEWEETQKRRRRGKKDSDRMDPQEIRALEDKFKDYKPTINLEYVDEHGRQLNAKEAYKQLSYRFHGKGPGKAKIEKKMKKLAEEVREQKR